MEVAMINPMSEAPELPAWRVRELVAARELSPVETTRAALERIAELEPRLHAFLTVAEDAALEQARELERSLAAGDPAGPLAGVPLSVKDNFLTKGIRTTAGSLLYRDLVPAEDSIHSERARRAGAVIVGKTNLPEFALFPRTTNRLGPETVNPWDTGRTCGGSSGGAAASVAAGMTPLAVASDGGGSTRIPAALCGVVGVHPSSGRIPRHGVLGPGTLVFSGAGPITRDVRDAALLFGVLAGPDPRDPTCLKDDPPDYLAALDHGVEGMRLLWLAERSDVDGLDPAVVETAERAAHRFEEAGAAVEAPDVSIGVDEWFEAFYTIMNADRYATGGQQLYEDPAARGLLSEYARDHFGRGRTVSGAEYSRALAARYRLADRLERLLAGYDLLLTPTVGVVAPRLDGPIVRRPLVGYTFFVNYVGWTAATVPCGLVDGLPVGLHLVARANDEAMLFRAARAFEQLQPWTTARPPGRKTPLRAAL
jgi:Asp-tRNA(Asn)/Glu-tRNA(Gln) amidotransferase A subunit family amidase